MTRWDTANAFVRGRSHIAGESPCQDRAYSVSSGKVTVIALADGAGSCLYSHYGAEIVVKEVSKLLRRQFRRYQRLENEHIKQSILKRLLKKLSRKSKRLRADSLSDLSSTLLFVAVSEGKYMTGHIGDGLIGCLIDGDSRILSYPENGEYLNTTFFITDKNARKHLRIGKGSVEGISGFILMSDGAGESLYDKRNAKLSPVCGQMLGWLDDNTSETVSEALRKNIEKFFIPKTNDDCSISIMKAVGTLPNKDKRCVLDNGISKIKSFYNKLIKSILHLV